MKPTNFPLRKNARREQAKARNEAWAKLSPQQQLAEIDRRFGKGKGAAKQRARIEAALKAPKKTPKKAEKKTKK